MSVFVCLESIKLTSLYDSFSYIKRAISIFQLRPTNSFLARKGIVPSTTTLYNLTDVVAALKSATGKTPTIQCNGKGSAYLHELWYQCVLKSRYSIIT